MPGGGKQTRREEGDRAPGHPGVDRGHEVEDASPRDQLRIAKGAFAVGGVRRDGLPTDEDQLPDDPDRPAQGKRANQDVASRVMGAPQNASQHRTQRGERRESHDGNQAGDEHHRESLRLVLKDRQDAVRKRRSIRDAGGRSRQVQGVNEREQGSQRKGGAGDGSQPSAPGTPAQRQLSSLGPTSAHYSHSMVAGGLELTS